MPNGNENRGPLLRQPRCRSSARGNGWRSSRRVLDGIPFARLHQSTPAGTLTAGPWQRRTGDAPSSTIFASSISAPRGKTYDDIASTRRFFALDERTGDCPLSERRGLRDLRSRVLAATSRYANATGTVGRRHHGGDPCCPADALDMRGTIFRLGRARRAEHRNCSTRRHLPRQRPGTMVAAAGRVLGLVPGNRLNSSASEVDPTRERGANVPECSCLPRC